MALGGDLSTMSGALMVGNFGDGHITALDPATGKVTGQLMDGSSTPMPITVDGLWGLAIGTGVQTARAGGLYFTAGPGEEMHGMFGVIAPTTTTTTTPPPTM